MSRRLLVGIFCLFPLLADAEEATQDRFASFAQYEPLEKMRFFTHYHDAGRRTPAYYWISAEGLITKDTPKEFQAFIERDPFYKKYNPHNEEEWIDFNNVTIHSCGGDETAAIQLGDLIHSYHLDVWVAQSGPDLFGGLPLFRSSNINGLCEGACKLVVLGGQPINDDILEEAIAADSTNGETSLGHIDPIHLSFFSTPRPIILDYAKARNIDPDLLDRLLPAAPGELRKLTFVQAAQLGIYYFPVWSQDFVHFQKERIKPCPAAISQIPIAD